MSLEERPGFLRKLMFEAVPPGPPAASALSVSPMDGQAFSRILVSDRTRTFLNDHLSSFSSLRKTLSAPVAGQVLRDGCH